MRQYISESLMREWANDLSEMITIIDSNGHETERKARKREREALYSVFYGAFLGLNWGEDARSNEKMEQAIIDAAEFTGDVLFNTILKDGERLQGYMSVYLPLKKVVREWWPKQ